MATYDKMTEALAGCTTTVVVETECLLARLLAGEYRLLARLLAGVTENLLVGTDPVG